MEINEKQELTPNALGQFAYVAYCIALGGEVRDPWSDLTEDERVAWRASADGVRMLADIHRGNASVSIS